MIIYVGRERGIKIVLRGNRRAESSQPYALPVAKLSRMESWRRDASPRGYLEILLSTVSRQVQPDITRRGVRHV